MTVGDFFQVVFSFFSVRVTSVCESQSSTSSTAKLLNFYFIFIMMVENSCREEE